MFLDEFFFIYVWFANILFSARLKPVLKDAVMAQQKAINVSKDFCIFWWPQVKHTLLCTTGLQTKGLKTGTGTEQ